MKNRKMLLIAAYLIGAVVDAAVSIPMFSMAFSGDYTNEVSYTLASGAILMIGWTFLLLWAAYKPVERRDVLLITLVPIIGLFITSLVINSQSAYPLEIFLFRIIGGPLLAALYVFTYLFSKHVTIERV
ncbi:MAG: hypothetical protein PHU70_08125 [Dehalococcoidia bacterium]|nr:hypothetical protein [Dehalococcoidia bacterium]